MQTEADQGVELVKTAAQAMLDGANGWLDIIAQANRAIDQKQELQPLHTSAAQLGASLALPARICATSEQTMPEVSERMTAWGKMMERVMAGCWLILTIESSDELAEAALPTLDEVLFCLPESDIEAVASKLDLSLLDQA